jgi:hypothetical protein
MAIKSSIVIGIVLWQGHLFKNLEGEEFKRDPIVEAGLERFCSGFGRCVPFVVIGKKWKLTFAGWSRQAL